MVTRPGAALLAAVFACFSCGRAMAVVNEEARLADPTVAAGSGSGTSVSISNGTAVVGAPAGNVAYVYVRDAANAWVLQQTLTGSDTLPGDEFGLAVSIGGDHLAVGAPGRGGRRGAIYSFVRSGGVWTQNGLLTAADGAGGDELGAAVSIQGTTLVAGAPFDDVSSKTDVGSAYIFENDGTTWVERFHIQVTSGQAKAGDHLGWSVALAGNTALIGAPDDDFGSKTDAGSVYVFVRNGAIWSRQARINPGGVAGDRTGSAVALFSNTALFGADGAAVGANADQGKVFVYRRSGTTWAAGGVLTAADGAAGDRFGASVAISGPLAIVGAPFADAAGADSGRAYVYGDAGAGYAALDTLIATTNAAGDRLGSSAALDSGRALIGAPSADANGGDSGAGYVFSLLASTTTTVTLVDPTPTVTGQSYGVSVSVTAASGIPPGTVDVSDGDGSTCTITLAAGAGSCTLTSVAASLHTISASYAGNLVFGSSLDTESHLVNPAATSIAIVSDTPDPSRVGESVSVTVALAVVAPGSGTPIGTVTVSGPATSGCAIDLALRTSCALSFNAAGATTLLATYAGDANFNGSASATEAHGVTVNLAPTANAQSVNTNEGAPVNIVLTGSDPELASLSYSVATQPTNGVLAGSGSNVTYTPNPNFAGADSFTFTVSDEANTSAPATVSISVANVDNDAPPVLTPGQAFAIAENSPAGTVVGTVTATDIDGDPITFAFNPLSATFSISAAGVVTVADPAALDFETNPSFTLTVTASDNISPAPGTGTITINVTDVNEDPVPTVVSISRASTNPATASPVQYSVVFSENVTGVDSGDFALVVTGTVTGQAISSVNCLNASCTVTVSIGDGAGTLGLNLVDNDSIRDSANQPLAGAANGSVTGPLFDVEIAGAGDNTPPSVVSVIRASPSPSPGPTVQFTVTFSEAVTGVGTTDFQLTLAGALASPAIAAVSGGGNVYLVTVSTGTGIGTIRLDVIDDDSILDGAANPLGGVTTGNGAYTTGEVYAIDTVNAISIFRDGFENPPAQ